MMRIGVIGSGDCSPEVAKGAEEVEKIRRARTPKEAVKKALEEARAGQNSG